MSRHTHGLGLLLVCVAAACTRERPPSDTTHVSANAPLVDTHDTAWVITPRGLGRLHAGMTRSEAEAVVGGPLAISGDNAWQSCGYARSERLPVGVHIMVENGTVARIDVDSATTVTAEGARVGDSEQRIQELYRGRVVTTPHKYTNGHYLTIAPQAAADSAFRIVFETDSGRVTTLRAGRIPAVEYVERCG